MASQCSERFLTPRKECFSQAFTPPETNNHAFDIILVVQDGRKFKAHRHVLSEASPYFEKLLTSGMKEAKEGIVCLESYTEVAMGSLLEFIYTGKIQTLTREIAIDLFIMADYFLLPNLKTLAEDFLLNSAETWIARHCVSTYYLAVKHNGKKLASKTESFIHENFLTIAKTEEFLNLSKTEVEMWISRDEINVSAEEDVFEIILAWINREKRERRKYFAELFCHVRLVYVSLDCLYSDFLRNDLVRQNEGCLDIVKQALKLIRSETHCDYVDTPVRPRKSLETPLIVACTERSVLCYFPREDKWFGLAKNPITNLRDCELASCCGKIYFFDPHDWQIKSNLIRRDSFSNRNDSFLLSWKSLPYKEHRYVKHIFVRNDNEIFALVTEACFDCVCLSCLCCRGLGRRKKLMSFITKYIPESNSWRDVASFDFGSREGMCIVTKDSFVYFIGGRVRELRGDICVKDTERYDLTSNQWDKVADIQEDRMFACGAASHGKIFVGGGVNKQRGKELDTCEVYIEATNEWHFIASMPTVPSVFSSMLCIDGKLYVIGGFYSYQQGGRVQCYDPETNEWNDGIEMPIGRKSSRLAQHCYFMACSMRVFKGFVDNLDSASTRRHVGLRNQLKCLVM